MINRIGIWCTALALLATGVPGGAAAADEWRLPLSRNPLGFVRQWLLCGPFAAPGGEKRAALTTDFLTAQGGEAEIRPQEGMTHVLPGGERVTWTAYASPTDRLDLAQYFHGVHGGKAAYAYTTIFRPAAGRAVLAIGSDDGVRVWLNGRLVHENRAERRVREDEDLVEVTLDAGENRLLLKIDQISGGWGACLRLRDSAPVAPVRRAGSSESLALQLGYADDRGELYATPTGYRGSTRLAFSVLVQVVAPGGAVVAERVVKSGERATFAVTRWPGGPYEVRARTAGQIDRPLVSQVTWYKGDPLAAARRLAATAPAAVSDDPRELVHALLAAYLTDRLGPELQVLPSESRQFVFSVLMEFAELEQERRGDPGPDHHGGFVRLAYRDAVDGAPQFGRVYLPIDYAPQRKWPLIINLHGKHESNPNYLRWGNMVRRYDDIARRYQAIVLYPHGRGNSFYQGNGEADVLRCLQMAKARFAVDEERVYLMGYSMGGAGTWHVGSRYPELFAALGPIYGGREYRLTTSERTLAQLTPAQAYRLERAKSSFVNAESLLTTPVFVNHGSDDKTVPVGISRYGVTLLRQWGYPVQYWEHAGKGHHAPLGCEEALYEWLLAQRRVAHPPLVRIRSGELRSAAAHWARIEARDHPAAFMRLEAEVAAPNTIRLTTDNVLQVTLSPAPPLVDPAHPLRVIWNGEERRVAMADGRVTLTADGYRPAAHGKTPQLEGPASDLYRTPFAIVQGTIADDAEMRAQCAEATRELVKQWADDQHWTPRVFLDTEISAADAARYSLLLVGGAEENLIAQHLREQLPLRVTPDAVVIDGRTFPATDAAVQVVCPSPLNADRYVVVLAATSPAGMKRRGALNGDVDFCIVDGRAAPWLAGGYFNNAWRLDARFVEAD